ncbi:MAG: hypothetical protein V8S58_01965 [Lachnospiraceae bacterium]
MYGSWKAEKAAVQAAAMQESMSASAAEAGKPGCRGKAEHIGHLCRIWGPFMELL